MLNQKKMKNKKDIMMLEIDLHFNTCPRSPWQYYTYIANVFGWSNKMLLEPIKVSHDNPLHLKTQVNDMFHMILMDQAFGVFDDRLCYNTVNRFEIPILNHFLHCCMEWISMKLS